MGPLVKRSEGSHWYTKDGAAAHDADLRIARKALLYPSVTTIDKAVFPNPFLQKWLQDQILLAAGDNPRMPHENGKQYAQRIYDISQEKSRTAMEFGVKIHDACEHHPELPLDQELIPWFNAFDVWWKSVGIAVVSREITLLDHDLGVAGRTDLIAHSPHTRFIVDYKTQDVKVDDKGRKKPVFYDSWLRQIAFYAGADAKANGRWPSLPACMNVIIDSNPDAGIYTKVWPAEEVLAAYKLFTVGAWMWFNDRDYWPNGKRWDPVFDLPQPTL